MDDLVINDAFDWKTTADYAPTNLVNMKLFGTIDDYSIPAEKRYYKTQNNLP